jgi:uncharacterized protein involved in response to NO
MTRAFQVLLSYAFRPFFLLNGWFAMGAITLWVIGLHGAAPDALPVASPLWHAHEMLFGFVMAAIAGFLLTAVATWTGRPAVHGATLAWLVAAWLAGRIAMLSVTAWPPILVAVTDLLFPAFLVALIGREVIAGGSRRNSPIVAIVLLLAVLNLGYHAGSLRWLPDQERLVLYLAIHVVLLLITIIAGRIVPSFTANWLRGRGVTRLPAPDGLLEPLVILATLSTGIVASVAPEHVVTVLLALVTAILHLVRLARWRGFATTAEPLLFILHIAYAWLPIGYALLGIAAWSSAVPFTASLHALSMGAIGSMILAVTTRVALGHTGRPLHAARLTTVAYGVFMVAVTARVMGPMVDGAGLAWIDVAAAGWVTAFALFSWVYWPILTRPALND